MLHESWRAPRSKGDGSFEPRIKDTKDETWINAHGGTSQVDIANSAYADLPSDWQMDNKLAAESTMAAIAVVLEEGVELEDIGTDVSLLERVAAQVHTDWVARHKGEAWNAHLCISYDELPESEREKDRVMVRTALKVLQ